VNGDGGRHPAEAPFLFVGAVGPAYNGISALTSGRMLVDPCVKVLLR
jgi:hypothetical protein